MVDKKDGGATVVGAGKRITRFMGVRGGGAKVTYSFL